MGFISVGVAGSVFSSTAFIAIFVGIMLSVIGIALAYLISSMFNYPEMKGWATNELGEVLRTIFIILLVPFAIIFINSMVINVMGYQSFPSIDPFNLENPFYFRYAITYLQSFKSYMWSMATNMVLFNMIYASLQGYSFQFLFIYLSPFAQFAFITGFMKKFMGLVVAGLMLAELQQQLLVFFMKYSLTLFFPFGVILRAFPLTRKTGSTVIAFALCGFFVYPLLLVFNSFMIENYVFGSPQVNPGVTASYYHLVDYDSTTLVGQADSSVSADQETFIENINTEFGQIDPNTFSDPVDGITGLGYEWTDQASVRFDQDATENKDQMIKTNKELIQNINAHPASSFAKGLYRSFGTLFRVIFGKEPTNMMQVFILTTLTYMTLYSERFIIMLVLFILDYVIFMTALKDFSLALGGEPIVHGVGKLKMMAGKV